MARWDAVRSFVRDAAVQAVGTLAAAAVVALAAALSGTIRYDARFTGQVVVVLVTAVGFFSVMAAMDRPRFRWWERVVGGMVALFGSYLLGAVLAAVVQVTTRRFNG